MHPYIHTRIHTNIRVCVHTTRIHRDRQIWTHIHTYIHTYSEMYTYIRACIHTCIRTCLPQFARAPRKSYFLFFETGCAKHICVRAAQLEVKHDFKVPASALHTAAWLPGRFSCNRSRHCAACVCQLAFPATQTHGLCGCTASGQSDVSGPGFAVFLLGRS